MAEIVFSRCAVVALEALRGSFLSQCLFRHTLFAYAIDCPATFERFWHILLPSSKLATGLIAELQECNVPMPEKAVNVAQQVYFPVHTRKGDRLECFTTKQYEAYTRHSSKGLITPIVRKRNPATVPRTHPGVREKVIDSRLPSGGNGSDVL